MIADQPLPLDEDRLRRLLEDLLQEKAESLVKYLTQQTIETVIATLREMGHLKAPETTAAEDIAEQRRTARARRRKETIH